MDGLNQKNSQSGNLEGGLIQISSYSNYDKIMTNNPEISFFGEEICFAMRAWTRGWDIYSPCVDILYHFYSRPNYKKIWKDRNVRPISWKDLENMSKDKQKRVLCGIEKGTFGAGNYRHLKAYEKLIGFNFKKMYGLTDSNNDSTIV